MPERGCAGARANACIRWRGSALAPLAVAVVPVHADLANRPIVAGLAGVVASGVARCVRIAMARVQIGAVVHG